MLFRVLARCSLAVLISFTAHGIAEAQATPSPSPSQTPIAEIGRVTTSDRRSEPIGQTSRPTFVVDRSQIDAEGARTLADALVGVPGVELFPYGPFGAQVDFGIRGATSARTLVLVDGQPVGDPTTGTVDPDQLSTVGVQRIEIVESAASALYGTSASGGVINVITNVPRGTYLEGSLGSFDDRDLRAGVGNGLVGASFERHVATNAYAYPAFIYGLPGCTTTFGTSCTYPAGVRENDYGDQSTGRISAALPLAADFAVRGRIDATSFDIGVPSRLDGLTPNTTNRSANDTALIEVARTTANGTLSLDVSGATQRSAYADPSFGEDDVSWGRSQLSFKDAITDRGVDVITGVDLTRASGIFAFPAVTTPANGTTPASTVPAFAIGASQSQAAAYVQVGTTPFNGARVIAGLRAEHDSPAGSVLAPSFGTVLRLAPNIRLAGNISESFTVPTLQDLYYPGYSNPNLQPEKSLDNDATLVLDSARGSLSLGWFSRSGSNFIVLNPATYIPFNAQRAQTAGIAVTARSKPIHGLIADLSFTNLYRALDLTTDARLPRSPVGQASAGITRPFGPTRTSFGVRFGVVGSDGDDTANVPPPLIGRYDSYTSVDAYVRCKLSKDGIVTVRGFNLGNDREAGLYRRTVVRVGAGCSGTNLDLWLDGEEGVRRHVSATAGEADILVIEGMMGLFDGDDEGATSTAKLARTLDATVLTVLDTWTASQSAAAVALGLRTYDPAVRHVGVILNRVGGPSHATAVRAACARAKIDVLAAIETRDDYRFPERLLGLDRGAVLTRTAAIEKLGAALSTQIDLRALIDAASSSALDAAVPAPKTPARARIAYAEDAAFWFTYPETLDALRAAGADLIPFSPLCDRELPSGIGALWIGGGYPEDHADALEANAAMRTALHDAITSGMPAYAECGGLMYLAETLHTAAGPRAMVGAVAGATSIAQPTLHLGYRAATVANRSPLDAAGSVVRGYEFHYATPMLEPGSPAYTIGDATDGTVRGNCLAAFLHRHFLPGDPAIDRFVGAAAAFIS